MRQEKASGPKARLASGLLPYFAKQFGRGEPKEFATRRNQSLEFHVCDSCFLQRGNVVPRTDGSRQNIVQMRSMTEQEDDGQIFVLGKFAEKLQGLGARK